MNRLRALLAPALTTAVFFALFVSLGVWQLNRLHEKEALIARIETRAKASPQDLPARADWPTLKPDEFDFRRVRASGHYLDGRSALLFTHTPEGYGQEPGYVVATPFALAEGGVVLVERGFIPASKAKDSALLAPPEGETAVTGVLRAPQSRNSFTPKDDLAHGIFFTRDPAAIAARRGLENAAPFTLVLEGQPAAGAWPRPVPAAPQITNNHLSYAFTWFGLAAAVVAVFAFYSRGVLKPAGKM